MKKNSLICFFCLLVTAVQASLSITRLDPKLFIYKPQLDWKKIVIQDENTKRKMVKELFDQEVLIHEFSKAYDGNARFEDYYAIQGKNYMLLDLDVDGKSELIFQGFVSKSDEKEFTEVYHRKKSKLELIYQQVGVLMAYKINPNTKEIVLFQHEYPCCSSFSHNIYTLRYLNKSFKIKSKYLLANDKEMKGDFFPDTAMLNGNYARLRKTTPVFWSGEKIMDKASITAVNNQIIHYPANTIYRILAREKGWKYVAIHGEPVPELSPVVNADNLKSMVLFAWMKE